MTKTEQNRVLAWRLKVLQPRRASGKPFRTQGVGGLYGPPSSGKLSLSSIINRRLVESARTT